MIKIVEGEYVYDKVYVIEGEDGALYGPFEGAVSAMTFAFERFEPPFTIRPAFRPVTN